MSIQDLFFIVSGVLLVIALNWLLNVASEFEDVCPRCGGAMNKAMYCGMAGRMCPDDDCAVLTGFAAHAADIWFNGWVIVYKGSYWLALWDWLRGNKTMMNMGDR